MPLILTLPVPLLTGKSRWHSVQLSSPGAFVCEGDGPDADACAFWPALRKLNDIPTARNRTMSVSFRAILRRAVFFMISIPDEVFFGRPKEANSLQSDYLKVR